MIRKNPYELVQNGIVDSDHPIEQAKRKMLEYAEPFSQAVLAEIGEVRGAIEFIRYERSGFFALTNTFLKEMLYEVERRDRRSDESFEDFTLIDEN